MVALVLFGILALLVTLLFVGQAVARQVVLEADDYATLRTLGVTRAQLVGIVVMRAAVLGLAGAAIALLVAALSSPLLPVGLARQAEIHPGFAFDAAILVPGAFALAALICALALIPAWRVSRPTAVSGDPGSLGVGGTWASGIVGRVAVPTTAGIGVRYGLEPGRGRSAVPVVSALVASTLGVAALAASLTFGSSLHNLISSPRQQGWNWDVLVGNPNDLQDEEAHDGPLLAEDPYVASYSAISILAGASQGNAAIDGHLVNALLAFDPLKGYVHPPVIAGHAPRADDQIVLASDTMQQLHKRIGQWVTVDGGSGKIRLRVVGEMISPSIGDLFTNGVGEGAWVYGPAVRKYAQSQQQSPSSSSTPPTVFNIFAVRYAPGVSKAAAFASLQRVFGRTVLEQLPAEDVVNLQSVDGLPLVLAALIVLLGVMTLGNTLVTSVTRQAQGPRDPEDHRLRAPADRRHRGLAGDVLRAAGAPGRTAGGDRGRTLGLERCRLGDRLCLSGDRPRPGRGPDSARDVGRRQRHCGLACVEGCADPPSLRDPKRVDRAAPYAQGPGRDRGDRANRHDLLSNLARSSTPATRSRGLFLSPG